MTELPSPAASPLAAPPRPDLASSAAFGMRGRMMALMALFVMATEMAIFAPSLAQFRAAWLDDRLSDARAAAIALERRPNDPSLAPELLESVGARALYLVENGARRRLAARMTLTRPSAVVAYHRDEETWLKATLDAVGVIFAKPGRVIAAWEPLDDEQRREVIAEFDEAPLREAMAKRAGFVLAAAAALSALAAALAMLAIDAMVLRPIRRLTDSIVAFANDPEDRRRIIRPTDARHEVGAAERALETMQTALSAELHERRRLAQLGLAVAKINHDLRNMLASAQLVSDRMATLDDPVARRLAPTLISTLDRAIAFCRSTLAYGRAVEPAPRVQPVEFARMAREAAEAVAPMTPNLVTRIEAPENFVVHADPEQLFRILLNLARNAAQALASAGAGEASPRLALSAYRLDDGQDAIEVADNGPGVPAAAQARLFEPFGAAGAAGGAGLGLAIAAELAKAHGGSLSLLETREGATFRLILPRPETL